MQTVDLIIEHIDWLITVDPQRCIIRDAAIAVNGGKIVAVGKSAEIAGSHNGKRTIDGRNATGRVYRGDQALGWTVLDGRRPRGQGEVMLGARLARTLDRGVGDRVTGIRDVPAGAGDGMAAGGKQARGESGEQKGLAHHVSP